MTLTARRIFYGCAIALFGIAAPLVLLYAQGYRIDIKHLRFFRTGAMNVISFPKNARVSIDGKQLSSTTPTLVLDLFPGTYAVTIVHERYQPWTDRIRVTPSSSTTVEATLLPRTPRVVTIPLDNTIALDYDEYHHRFAVASRVDRTITIGTIDLTDDPTYRDLASFQTKDLSEVHLTWSGRGRYLAVYQPQELFAILSGLDGSDRTPSVPSQWTPSRVSWDPSNENIMYALERGSLWKFDLFSDTSRVVTSPGVRDFSAEESTLWVLRSGVQIDFIERRATDGVSAVIETRELDFSPQLILFAHGNRLLVKDDERISIIDRSSDILTSVAVKGVVDVEPDSQKGLVLLRTDNELWVADVSSMTISLVGRFATLEDATWYPQRPVVLVLTDSTVRTIDVRTPTAQSGSLGPFPNASTINSGDDATVVLTTPDRIEVVSIVI